MIIKASGRSALILATGLLVWLAGPSPASAGAEAATASSKSASTAGTPIALKKYARHGSRHFKGYAHRQSDKTAQKPAGGAKAAAADGTDSDGNNPSAISPSVANANAQLAPSDTRTGNAKPVSARANDIPSSSPGIPADGRPAAETQVVSADQLNDVDRALHENPSLAPPSAVAPAEAPILAAAPVAPMMASSIEGSTWDQTSLIGKIFIGFGALLTMASAARMFMA